MELPPTQQRLMTFIRREFRPGYNHYNVSKLVGDASTREYFRCFAQSNESFILAVYPESFDPKRFSYREVYDLFREIGVPVPEIIAMDGELGIVLQEDLGDESLQRRLLNADDAQRHALLRQAIDHIVCIQKEGTRSLKPESGIAQMAFDEGKLNWELQFFRTHYLDGYRHLELEDEEQLTKEFSALALELAQFPQFICHRDYHVRNLMLKDGQVYIIDFQDARWGPPSYDLVSLLKDSIELEPAEILKLQNYYLEQTSLSEENETFERQFNLMCVQRLLKALGTYGYQIVKRSHFSYEQYMKGSLHRCFLSLQAVPEFPYIQSIVENELRS